MPQRPRTNRTCLSPHDLAICQRLFDRICADEDPGPLSQQGEILAETVVATFRNAHTDERELLRQSGLVAEIEQQNFSRPTRSGLTHSALSPEQARELVKATTNDRAAWISRCEVIEGRPATTP